MAEEEVEKVEAGVDLSQFDSVTLANKGVDIYLKDVRTGAKTKAYITIQGSDSDAFQAFRLEKEREMVEKVQRKEEVKLSTEENRKETIETLTRFTLGWYGLTEGGKPLPFTIENAKMLYTKYPAIREQIDRAMVDRTNFLKA